MRLTATLKSRNLWLVLKAHHCSPLPISKISAVMWPAHWQLYLTRDQKIRWIQLPTHERAWITLLSVSSTTKEKAAAHFLFVLTPPEIGTIDRSCVRYFRRISSSWNTSNPPSLAWNQRECSWPRLLIINKLNRVLPGSFDQVCTGATSLALLSKNDWLNDFSSENTAEDRIKANYNRNRTSLQWCSDHRRSVFWSMKNQCPSNPLIRLTVVVMQTHRR